jgi:hypothetical protein
VLTKIRKRVVVYLVRREGLVFMEVLYDETGIGIENPQRITHSGSNSTSIHGETRRSVRCLRGYVHA